MGEARGLGLVSQILPALLLGTWKLIINGEDWPRHDGIAVCLFSLASLESLLKHMGIKFSSFRPWYPFDDIS